MNWTETMELLDWMTPRWTETGRWSEERIYAFYEDLEHWPYDAVRTAVRSLYEDGTKAPNGGTVVKTLRNLGYSPTVESTEHRHRWAILEYEDERDDGRRLGVCVFGTPGDRCFEERTFDPGELLSVGELEESRG